MPTATFQTLNLPKTFSLTQDLSCLLRANVIHYEMRDYFDLGASVCSLAGQE